MHGLNLILAIIYYVVVVLTIVHVVLDNRQPAKTMAWALVIWFVPVIGIVLYLFFGVNTRKERLVSQRSLDELSKRSMLGFVEQQNLEIPKDYRPVIDLFVNQSFSLPFRVDHVDIFTSGYQFFPQLLSDIGNARNHIHIDMYIFEEDPLGNLVADALIAKARAGVEVRVIYDDVGCWNVRHSFYEHLREEGIEVVPFLPVRFPSFTSKVNYRNHRKLIVIDGATGYMGGMNIALRYVKGIERGARSEERGTRSEERGAGCLPWRDTMVRVTGMAVCALQRTFLIDWYFVDRTLINGRRYYPITPSLQPTQPMLMQAVASSPDSPQPEIMQGYVSIISQARHFIYIETPYFLPTEPVFFALKTAAAAGVDVRILIPRQNDARFADWAGRSYLREANDAGIRVSLYTAGFLHSKLMVCDDAIASCGSSNLDFRSFENNFEANLFFYGQEVAQRLRQVYLDDEATSVPLQKLPGRLRPKFFVRLLESLARLMAPLM